MLIDCYDSFSHNLQALVRSNGVECCVVRVNELKDLKNIPKISGIILSPGPGQPNDYPELQQFFIEHYRQWPFLGVCLGHQLIGTYFGLKLTKLSYPIHGKIRKVEQIDNHAMFRLFPRQFKVTRYHSLVLEMAETPNLAITARDLNEGWPMAFAHNNLPIWGVQYHPEAFCTEYGNQLLTNWLNFTNVAT
ncbi:MAG: aminodeoxychorismate/anthranilate synthase component II [Bacteroidetes bacterium]|nr:aminodeoxychorismate/anthranilate synthase component II [Bacteroidota bacterium]